jgi:2-methylcitrate dehydratase PrpD
MGHADSAATEDLVFCKLSSYVANLISSDISPGAVHAAKIRIIDTLGALIGGFDGQPCATARRLAAAAPRANGATVLATTRSNSRQRRIQA